MSERRSEADALVLEDGVAPAPPRVIRRGLRFKGDRLPQCDLLEAGRRPVVPADHVVRAVVEWVEKLDLTAFRAKHSPLGRMPMDPKFKLRVWVYASLVGMHAATRVASALKTDAAFQLAAGGHAIGVSVLKDFRASHFDALRDLNSQVLRLAVTAKLVSPRDLAVDSMRLEADASSGSIRTLERSRKRLDELNRADTASMTEAQRAAHTDKVSKHSAAIARCKAEGRTSFSTTAAEASLMKFPSGASKLGHRISLAAAGQSERIVVHAFVDGAATDYGKLEALVMGARDALIAAGIPVIQGAAPMQVAADAGYMKASDQAFVVRERAARRVDVILPAPTEAPTGRHFGRDAFVFEDNGDVICPAGKPMSGPTTSADGRKTWQGRGCGACPLRAECTDGERRTISLNPATDALRREIAARAAEPGAKARYGRRMATVEPVFSYIEDVMGFTRASSGRTKTVHAEVQMKILAYNLTRLMAAAKRGGRMHALALVFAERPNGFELCDLWWPQDGSDSDGEPAAT